MHMSRVEKFIDVIQQTFPPDDAERVVERLQDVLDDLRQQWFEMDAAEPAVDFLAEPGADAPVPAAAPAAPSSAATDAASEDPGSAEPAVDPAPAPAAAPAAAPATSLPAPSSASSKVCFCAPTIVINMHIC